MSELYNNEVVVWRGHKEEWTKRNYASSNAHYFDSGHISHGRDTWAFDIGKYNVHSVGDEYIVTQKRVTFWPLAYEAFFVGNSAGVRAEREAVQQIGDLTIIDFTRIHDETIFVGPTAKQNFYRVLFGQNHPFVSRREKKEQDKMGKQTVWQFRKNKWRLESTKEGFFFFNRRVEDGKQGQEIRHFPHADFELVVLPDHYEVRRKEPKSEFRQGWEAAVDYLEGKTSSEGIVKISSESVYSETGYSGGTSRKKISPDSVTCTYHPEVVRKACPR